MAKYIKILPIGLAAALSLFGDLSLFAGLVTQLEVVNLTLAQVGIILSVHRLVRIPGNLVVGYLQDRLGRRPLFILGMTLAVLSTAAYGLVHGFWPFLLSRVMWGAAWALINICGTTMVLDQSSEHDRGSLTGFLNAWIWVGYGIGPLVGSLLMDALSFQRAMLICSGLTAVGLAAALFIRPAPYAQKLDRFVSGLRSSLDFKRQPGMLNRTLLVFSIVQFAGDGVTLGTLTLLLTDRLGQVISLGGWQLSAVAAGGVFIAGRAVLGGLTSLAAGRLSDGLMRRPWIVSLSLGVGIAGFAVMMLAGSTEWIILGLALNSLSNGAAIAVLPALVRDYTRPEQLGKSMGTFAMVGDIGSTSGPALAFAVAPGLGLGAVYGLCVLLFTACLAVFVKNAALPEGAKELNR